MSIERERLRDTLEQLHEQLHETHEVDEEMAERLRTTMAEIHAALEREQNEADEESPFAGRLNEAAANFQQTHPTIAGTLQRLVDLLGQMGI